jgi:hypothetical protein
MRWISGWEDWTSFDLYAAIATPASAHEVVYNPGYVRSSIRTRTARTKQLTVPYTGDYQQRNQIRRAYAGGAGPCAMGAEYYVGRGGPHYACY